MGALVGVRDPARHLPRVHAPRRAHEAEHRHRVADAAGHAVTGLLHALAEVDAAAVKPRRRAGLQAPLRQLEFLEPRRQADRRRVTGAPGRVVVQAHVDLAVQEGAGRQHHGSAAKLDTDLRHGAHHPVALHHQVVHRLLEQPQVGLIFQPAANRGLVQDAVGLGTGGAHRRTLGAVENAELDAAFVGGNGHGAAQRIDFLDQMALADAPDGGVAAHLAQRLDVVRQQQRPAAHARCGQRRLGAGVAAADHDHIEFLRVKHGDSGRGGAVSALHGQAGREPRFYRPAGSSALSEDATRQRRHEGLLS